MRATGHEIKDALMFSCDAACVEHEHDETEPFDRQAPLSRGGWPMLPPCTSAFRPSENSQVGSVPAVPGLLTWL